MTQGIFEYDSTTGAKVGPLTLLGQLVGIDGSGDGIYVPLNVQYLGANTLPKVPGSPSLSGSMTSRTTADLSWVPFTDVAGTPPVTSWQVQRRSSTDNGASFGVFADISGSPFAVTPTLLHRTGLPTGTPELVFGYRIRGTNSVGDGEWSNELRLQYQGAPVGTPTAPTNLTRGTTTSTSVMLQWSETADASVTKHSVYRGVALLVDNLSASATSTTVTGLTPNTTYTLAVSRTNAQGSSPLSNSVTFTTPTGSGPSVITMMGSSQNQTVSGDWDGYRVYTSSALYSRANQTGSRRVKFLAYSEDGPNIGGSNPNYTTVFNHVRDELDTFYYGGTGQTFSARWGIKFYWSNGNENYAKGALSATPHTAAGISAYTVSMKALYDACHYIDPVTGNRRYPDAYAGSNPTTAHERTGRVQDALHPTARYHDFVMWSMYPTGISDGSPGGSDPTFNWPSFAEADRQNIDKGFLLRTFYRTKAAEAQARIDLGNPNFRLQIATGETGIGVDTTSTDATERPYWTVHAVAGPIHLLQVQYDLDMPFACWWDNTVDVRPSSFDQDPTGTNPSTAECWRNWRNYDHRFGGTHPASWAANPKASWKTTPPVV